MLLFSFTLQAGPNWSQPEQPYAHLDMAVTLEKNEPRGVRVLYAHTHSYNAYKNGTVKDLQTTIDSSDNSSHDNSNALYKVETEFLSPDPKLLTNPTLEYATIQCTIKDLSKNVQPALFDSMKIDVLLPQGSTEVRMDDLFFTLKIKVNMMLYFKKQ